MAGPTTLLEGFLGFSLLEIRSSAIGSSPRSSDPSPRRKGGDPAAEQPSTTMFLLLKVAPGYCELGLLSPPLGPAFPAAEPRSTSRPLCVSPTATDFAVLCLVRTAFCAMGGLSVGGTSHGVARGRNGAGSTTCPARATRHPCHSDLTRRLGNPWFRQISGQAAAVAAVPSKSKCAAGPPTRAGGRKATEMSAW